MLKVFASRITSLNALVVLGTALLTGCGSSLESSVSGTVTLDGQPIKGGETEGAAMVNFHAVGEGATAFGQIDAEGRYEINTGGEEGITPGEYIVTVIATEPLPEQGPNFSYKPPKVLTPPKYANVKDSDLRYTIEAGSNTIDIELSSK